VQDTSLADAVALLQVGDAAGALASLQAHLAADAFYGTSQEFDFWVAQALHDLNRNQAALDSVAGWLGSADIWPQTRLVAAQAHLTLGVNDSLESDAARTLFALILTETPGSLVEAAALYGKGVSDYQLGINRAGGYDEALSLLTDYQTRFPAGADIAGAGYYKGKVQFDRANYAAATVEWEEVMTRWPATRFKDDVLYYLGQALLQLNRNADAVTRFTQLITERPDSRWVVRSYYWRGRAEILVGLLRTDSVLALQDYRASLTDLDAYVAGDTAAVLWFGSESQLYRGEDYYYLGKFDSAVTVLSALETLYPASPDIAPALVYLGKSQMGQLNYTAAIATFRRVLAEFPNSVWRDDAQFQIGKSLYRQGEPSTGSMVPQDAAKLTQATVELKLVLSSYPTSAKIDNALLYLVRAYSELNDCSNANNYLQQMQQDYPSSTLLPYAQNHSALLANCPA
jgi:TolA-binding protein